MNNGTTALSLFLVALVAAQPACSRDEPLTAEERSGNGAATSRPPPLATPPPPTSTTAEPQQREAPGQVLREFRSLPRVPGTFDPSRPGTFDRTGPGTFEPPIEVPDQRRPMIVNGQKADPQEFPWMALLTRSDDTDVVCSGALIKPTWVLTADHCLDTIREGDLVHFWSGPIAVKETFPHGGENDVALIELENAAPHAAISIGPAPAVDATVVIIGFGEDEHGATGVLNFAAAKVVAGGHCSGIQMTSNMLCVGDDKSVVCFGDSGGPLLDGARLVGVANRIDHTILCGPAPAGGLRVGAFAVANAYSTWIDTTTGG